jgi:malate dehydrogenase (oxaloacetate-decarboxylating)
MERMSQELDQLAREMAQRMSSLTELRGHLEERRSDYPDKWRICNETNGARRVGGLAEALRGADVCVAYSSSGPGIIDPAWVSTMARDGIVFACANPIPEIWPWEAKKAGARVVATGRSDFPNQLNNSLVFPGLFRGVLDVRARTITDGMASAAARALAGFARDRGLDEDDVLPRMDEWEVHVRVAVAAATAAQREGLARVARGAEELAAGAARVMREAREATDALMKAGLIPSVPEEL